MRRRRHAMAAMAVLAGCSVAAGAARGSDWTADLLRVREELSAPGFRNALSNAQFVGAPPYRKRPLGESPPREADPVIRQTTRLTATHGDAFLHLFPDAGAFADWVLSADDTGFERTAVGELLGRLRQPDALKAELDGLSARGASATRAEWLALYEKAFGAWRAERRARCPKIVFVERPPRCRTGTNATMFSRVRGEGSVVRVLDPADPSAGARAIFTTEKGMVYDLCPSFDATRILMTYREEQDEPFHLWDMRADGSGLRKLTDGPWHDFNPAYLPDGRIVFASSRVESYSLCQNFLASALYVCDADGGNIRRIDFTTLCSTAPSVLPDGTIAFTRWEYQDKNIFSWQGLWSIRPSGRQLQLYYGNTITIPNSLYGPKPVPGTDLVMFTMAAHHHEPVGDIAVVDRRAGVERVEAMTQRTFATNYRPTKGRDWRDTNWGPGDIFYPWSFTDPCPLDADLAVVSYGGYRLDLHGDRGMYEAMAKPGYELYLLGADGSLSGLHREPGTSFFNAAPLAPRPVPPALVDDPPAADGEPGVFYVADVYRGLEEQGVKRGQVTDLRVWRQVPKKYNTEGPRFHDHYPIVGYGTYYVKEILGTVPVEADGSVHFRAPSGVELYFQALDAGGREIVRMGSVTQAQPGERVACLGCHDNRLSAAPPALPPSRRLASVPRDLEPPAWGAGPVGYVDLVQPVLDRYCVSCHGGPRTDGGVDLSGDKTRFFSASYETLCLDGWVEYYYINPGPTGNFPALSSGSWVSRLRKLLEEKHAGVDVDPESRRRIYAWIDSNVCYYPTWDMHRPYTQGGRDPCVRFVEGRGLVPESWFVKIRQVVEAKGLAEPASRDFNLTRPEFSRLLKRYLARSAGGLAPDGKAAFTTPDDPEYKALLEALREGTRSLSENPRTDMPGSIAVPQERDFGRVF